MLRLTIYPSAKRQRRLPSKLAFVVVLVSQVYHLVLPLLPNPKYCLVNLRLRRCVKIRMISSSQLGKTEASSRSLMPCPPPRSQKLGSRSLFEICLFPEENLNGRRRPFFKVPSTS